MTIYPTLSHTSFTFRGAGLEPRPLSLWQTVRKATHRAQGRKADHGPQGTYGQRPVQPKGRRRQSTAGSENVCPAQCEFGAGCTSILDTG